MNQNRTILRQWLGAVLGAVIIAAAVPATAWGQTGTNQGVRVKTATGETTTNVTRVASEDKDGTATSATPEGTNTTVSDGTTITAGRAKTVTVTTTGPRPNPTTGKMQVAKVTVRKIEDIPMTAFSINDIDVTYGTDATFTITDIAPTYADESQRTVTWSITDGTAASIGATTGVLHPTQAGTVTVTATDTHNPSLSASKEVTIAKKTPTLSFSPESYTFNASTTTNATTTATISYDGDGTLSVSSNATGVATVSDINNSNQITITRKTANSGSATITVSATETTNYTANSATMSISLTATNPLANATSAHVGYYVCTDGNYYSPSTPIPSGKTVAGMIAYVSSKGHGLIIAKSDANNGVSDNYSGMENACRNYTPTITAGGTTLSWRLPSKTEFENMGADQQKTINSRLEALSDRGVNTITSLLYLTSKLPNSDTYWRYAPNTGNWFEENGSGLYSEGRACASFDF